MRSFDTDIPGGRAIGTRRKTEGWAVRRVCVARSFYSKSRGIIGMTGIQALTGQNSDRERESLVVVVDLCDGKEFGRMNYGNIIRVY